MVEPRVDVAGLRLRLERRPRLVPARHPSRVKYGPEVLGQGFHLRRCAFVEDPAVVLVGDPAKRLQLLANHVKRFVTGNAECDQRNP